MGMQARLMSQALRKLTALKKGTTQIRIDYQPGSTSHSTIVEAGTSKNILGAVTPLSIAIE
jgi:RecA/RadA recombinase